MRHGQPSRLKSFFTLAAVGLSMAANAATPLLPSLKKSPAAITRLAPILNTQGAPRLSDEQLLDAVQRQTLRYFWDYGDPATGMARERTNGREAYGRDIVCTGGTGFGIMAMIAGTSRGWLTRDEVRDRVEKIVEFVSDKADKFHGFLPHYLDPQTGHAFVMNPKDDGADIVETSYLLMGLLSARQYFDRDNARETALRDKINTLWEVCDWQFQTRGQQALYWHWSPTQGFVMNLPISQPNEAQLAYILAVSSPTHPVDPSVYHHGWAKDGRQTAENDPEKQPLFFAHYSYLGLDPRGLNDGHVDYWEQNSKLVRTHIDYALRNPHHHKGYGADVWGLTSGDGPDGYHEYSPASDAGVIEPTGAISSLPYAPVEAMRALRRDYEGFGGKLWREYGPADAFNPETGWVAETNLAIDQGPEDVMIENYRTGLLWNLFMSAPEIRSGLKRTGISSPHLNAADTLSMQNTEPQKEQSQTGNPLQIDRRRNQTFDL